MWAAALLIVQIIFTYGYMAEYNLETYETKTSKNYNYSLLFYFTFYGGPKQFAEFQPWKLRNNYESGQRQTQLSFELRTKLNNSFLMYLDDKQSNFIALNIKYGYLQLRFRFGQSISVLPGDIIVDDNKWHHVQLIRNPSSITVAVDGSPRTGWIRQKLRSDRFEPHAGIFFGGLPTDVRLQELALPSIATRPRFVGEIRKAKMNEEKLICVKKHGVVIQTKAHFCFRNSCKINGKCYARREKNYCDCSSASFKEVDCRKTTKEALASFSGSGWLRYSLTKTLSTYDDEITLSFATTHPSGLLLRTEASSDYLVLQLREGLVSLVVNLGSGPNEVMIEPEKESFSDGKWHSIRVNRTLQEISLSVDQTQILNKFLPVKHFQLMLDDALYIGGSPNRSHLPGVAYFNNFKGCLKEVTYRNSDYQNIPISKLARDRHVAVSVQGKVNFFCHGQNSRLSISFLTSESLLAIPSWKSVRRGSIEFYFKTIEKRGILFCTHSQSSDVVGVELYNSKIFITINLGYGTSKFQMSSIVSDGRWHFFRLVRFGKNISITLDDVTKNSFIFGPDTILDVSNRILVGNTEFNLQFGSRQILKNGPTGKGFIGCMSDFRMDNNFIDLQALAQTNGTFVDGVYPDCLTSKRDQCFSFPCKNNGKCKEGSNRFMCDCSNTSYFGRTCQQEVTRSSFNGSQFINFPMINTISMEKEEISLRFRTFLSQGVIFATTSNQTGDAILIQLVNGGKVRLDFRLECSTKKNCSQFQTERAPNILTAGSELNDRKWHFVRFSRQGLFLSLVVDGHEVKDKLKEKNNKLQFDTIHLGKIVTGSNFKSPRKRWLKARYPKPFVGEIENVIFNTHMIIDRCANKSIVCKNNSSIVDVDILHPTSFQDEESFIELSFLKSYRWMSLMLSFKTPVSEGLILHRSEGNGNYYAINMKSGKIYWICKRGKTEQVFTPYGNVLFNDDQWHDVVVVQTEKASYSVTIDRMPLLFLSQKTASVLNKQDRFYLGGFPRQIRQSTNTSEEEIHQSGFRGCLGNLILNGKLVKMTGNKASVHGLVLNGCITPPNVCLPTTCQHGGKCIQKWTSFVCNCDLTAYVGSNCQTADATYVFGQNKGLIWYEWDDIHPSPRSDDLVVGFSTTQSDALLVKVIGSVVNNVQNILELSIKHGQLFLRFNIGSYDVTLQETKLVSDGEYHLCTVKRIWMNATMRVDNWPIRSTTQPIRTNTVFTSQSIILIGGDLDVQLFRENNLLNITRAFQGKIVKCSFNNIPISDWAKSGDSRVKILGNISLSPNNVSVSLHGKPSIEQSTPATSTSFSTTAFANDDFYPTQFCDEEGCSVFPSYTGSVPIKNGSTKRSIGIVLSILLGACLCLAMLIFLLFSYVKRRSLPCLPTKRRPKNKRSAYLSGKHIVIGGNGTIVKQVPNHPSQNSNKEIYV